MSENRYKVAVFVETARAYGRALCEGIADFAQGNGHWIFEGGGDSWQNNVRMLPRDVDGVIARIPDAKMARALARLNVPVIDIYHWGQYAGISSVDADHAAIGRMAATWFMERRFKNYAFCGYAGAPFSDLRGEFFRKTVEAQGLTCAIYRGKKYENDYLGHMILQAESYGEAPDQLRLLQWLKKLPRPTAIFCCHDIRAYHVAMLCKEAGFDVPHEVAVMGVDNDRILCSFSDPMLSSIDPDAHRIGWLAAQHLYARMQYKHTAIQNMVVSPKQIVERASTEIDPVEPQWLSHALRYIRQNLSSGVNAEEVIRFVELSHTQVERTFSRVLGCTIHQEIARLRMREACRLLLETTLSAAEVGKQSGFSSPQYFNRSFMLQFQQTPGHYRLYNTRKK